MGRLVFDPAGNLYGATIEGGGDGYQGTAFQMQHSSAGWTEAILHRFNQTNGDGFLPQSGVIPDASGTLYGTTYSGARYQQGVVYKLTLNENGGYTESALHVFTGGDDGGQPEATPVMDTAGNL